jgi:hypothetical protein
MRFGRKIPISRSSTVVRLLCLAQIGEIVIALVSPVLDIAAHADPEEGIRQGLADAKKGKTRPAREFFAEFEATHGVSR